MLADIEEYTKDQSDAYRNFINSVDSSATKHNYRTVFPYFMKFCKVEKYEDMLHIGSKKIEDLVRDYIIHLREDRKLSSSSVALYISAITHFYEMNDITLHWKKLKKFKGRLKSVVEDQPYTREQIKTLIDAAPLRDKCIILVMASAGLRRGAIPSLRIKDIIRIEKYALYRINVYKREQEQYTTFCTPECAKYIDQYLDWRQRSGEKLQANSPLFRRSFDITTQINRPITLSEFGISYIISRLLYTTAVRIPQENKKRTELMQTHDFRKFFKTTCIKSGMNPLYLEYLMGHRSALTKSYFKPADTELLEGNNKALGYVAAINDLTINEEYRLHKKIDELTKKKDEIELREIKHREELKSMREEMEKKFQQIITKIDASKLS